MNSLLLPTCVLLAAVVRSAVSDCHIAPYDDLSPIVTLHNKNEYIYPQSWNNNLIFGAKTQIDIICPGGTVLIGSSSYINLVSATCISNSQFEVHGKRVQWNQISCNRIPERIARHSGNSCENNGREIELGIELPNRFIRSMSVCFDQSTQQALYTFLRIPHVINLRITSTPRPSWLMGRQLFNITLVDSYYAQANQRRTINALLGLPESSTKYIRNSNFALARGHMSARSDNFFASQQNQTFFLVNAAPQWQIFNANNWFRVESSVRDLAEARNVDLLQWTGVHGIQKLPHSVTGEPIDLYLYNVNNVKLLPVPEVFWKVVYEPISQTGVAIIGLNNPYSQSYNLFCTNIASRISWLFVQWGNVERGLIYACEISDFRRTVNYLPSFTTRGVLV